MEHSETSQVTRLLRDWRQGRGEALAELTPIVYRELRRVAAAYMRGQRPEHALQPTALINEAYLRLIGRDQPEWQDRIHFLATASQIMRQVLVDFARSERAAKRDFGDRVTIDDQLTGPRKDPVDFLALNQALERLAEFDPRKAQVIQLRYFGGLSLEETAEALTLSVPTVRRDMALAQTWLRRELQPVGGEL